MLEVALPLFLLGIVYYIFMTKRKYKKLAEENRKKGNAFLGLNRDEKGVVQTDSGLQYLRLKAGDGKEHPSSVSNVTVHYHGTLIDGEVFDSSVERGEPITFALNQVIPGWTEGLQMMVVGEKARLFIPAKLAYGEGAVGNIEPGSTLIFDIELIDFS